MTLKILILLPGEKQTFQSVNKRSPINVVSIVDLVNFFPSSLSPLSQISGTDYFYVCMEEIMESMDTCHKSLISTERSEFAPHK